MNSDEKLTSEQEEEIEQSIKWHCHHQFKNAKDDEDAVARGGFPFREMTERSDANFFNSDTEKKMDILAFNKLLVEGH